MLSGIYLSGSGKCPQMRGGILHGVPGSLVFVQVLTLYF